MYDKSNNKNNVCLQEICVNQNVFVNITHFDLQLYVNETISLR